VQTPSQSIWILFNELSARDGRLPGWHFAWTLNGAQVSGRASRPFCRMWSGNSTLHRVHVCSRKNRTLILTIIYIYILLLLLYIYMYMYTHTCNYNIVFNYHHIIYHHLISFNYTMIIYDHLQPLQHFGRPWPWKGQRQRQENSGAGYDWKTTCHEPIISNHKPRIFFFRSLLKNLKPDGQTYIRTGRKCACVCVCGPSEKM